MSAPRPPVQRDPAASMSLLTQILANPIDAGYHAYTRDKRPMSWPVRVGVLLLAILLGAASVVAVRNLRAPATVSVHEELLAQLDDRQAQVSALEEEVKSLSAQISTATALAAPTSTSDDLPLALANGMRTVHGPGLEVKVEDGASTGLDGSTRAKAVRDQDLRMVVNALWSAGAEAVSVNDIRVGPGTFIRTAGSSILVNITPVQSPYTVRAIGDAQELSVSLVRGASGDYLSSVESVNGIRVSAKAVKDVTMEGLELRTLNTILTGTASGKENDR